MTGQVLFVDVVLTVFHGSTLSTVVGKVSACLGGVEQATNLGKATLLGSPDAISACIILCHRE